MIISRRALVLGSGGLLAANEPADSSADGASLLGGRNPRVVFRKVALRGFGTISARHKRAPSGLSSLTHVVCESKEKALLMQAKYLSDLERLPGVRISQIRYGRQFVPCRSLKSGARIVCAAIGKDVLIIAAKSDTAITFAMHDSLPATMSASSFRPRIKVPMWLDRWDKYGLMSYYNPEASPAGVELQQYRAEVPIDFASKNGPLGLVIWTNPLPDDYAEGLTNEQSWAWAQENAKQRGIPVHINTQISPPQVWLSNRFREQTMLKCPRFIGGYYGVGSDSAGSGAISWLSREGEDALLGIFQGIVRRFVGDPNIVGWLEPHGETAETPQKYFLESGPNADNVWRTFLKNHYGSLAGVSERWHGSRTTLRDWSEVRVPEIAEFVGFNRDSIDLSGVWKVKSAPQNGTLAPYSKDFDDAAWDMMDSPGNDRMLTMDRKPIIYRRSVKLPPGWIDESEKVYLYIWDMVNGDSDKTHVYVNGQQATEHSHLVNEQHWSHVDVSSLVDTGDNTFVLHMPRGIICYRVYLSKSEPVEYPNLGAHANARWVDFVQWVIESRTDQIRRGTEMIRQVDPDRSINFMAPGDFSEGIVKLCREYGGRFHDTGAMAGFWTEENTLMMTGAGLPVTAEPGNGAANVRDFQLFWGRWLTEGVNGVHYFMNLGDIIWNPEILKVFLANRQMYEAVGKYHSPTAQVAVLYSLDNSCLRSFPWSQNEYSQSGYYSAYNAAEHLLNYCPRDGVGAGEFESTTISRYKVIIDSNTSVMSQQLVSGIERYIRAGGIFITYGQSGRHSPTVQDAWPIERLSGFSHIADIPWGASSVTVSPGQTILSSSHLPDHTMERGYSLRPNAPECMTIATWADGSTAIGIRKIGTGWFVQMAPAFGGDRFAPVVGALMRHFGMLDRVPAQCSPAPGVRLRHFVGNSGLHDIWVLFNESDSDANVRLNFQPGRTSETLVNIVSGEASRMSHSSDASNFLDISLPKWQCRMYVSERPDAVASPLEWLMLQRNWWQGTAEPPRKRLLTSGEQQKFSLDLTAGWAFKDVTGSTDPEADTMMSTLFDDSGWERRRFELYTVPFRPSGSRIILRRIFTVPRHWIDGEISLCADIPGQQFVGQTRIAIDGVAWNGGRRSVDGPYLDTFNGIFTPGSSHLLSLDIVTQTDLIGPMGPIWLYYLPEPNERLSLAGKWSCSSDAIHRIGDFDIPGSVPGQYVSRPVLIDEHHKKSTVVFYYEASGERYSLMINGRLLRRGEQVRQHKSAFNVTPFIDFGQLNTFELVGRAGTDMHSIERVELRFYAKGTYP